jgi:D-lyxose ketol-isomerase
MPVRRSEVNTIMREADGFIRQRGFHLPPFAYWSPHDWTNKGEEAREIADNQLGWDITDFGSSRFEACGLFLFTLRNGSLAELEAKRGKLYCEKLMVVGINQVTPMHFHWNKVEDIINRGGGKLVVEVHSATVKDGLADSPVTVSIDGTQHAVEAGHRFALAPGESITLPPRLYHEFWGAENRVLVGEVSLVNDDRADNHFHRAVGRFPLIEEDEPPMHLLVTDYPRYYKHTKT